MKEKREKQDANRDPLTCEPGAHPVGTGVGATAGGAAGAAAGTAAGPIGAGIGLAAGAVIGGMAGHAGGEALNPTSSPSIGRFIDYDVVDREGKSVGTVDAVWQDHTGQPAYLAVRTGWLHIGKAHVVPTHSAQVSESRRRIKLPYTSDQVKNAPSFDCSAELKDQGIQQVETHYGALRPTRGERPGTEEAQITLKEEDVKVGKREVEYGGIRLKKIVRTETVKQPVELKREEIVVERVPAGEAASATDTAFDEEEIYIPLRREEAVVAKESHVREEVKVGKRTEREEQTISETIRKEDVEIEQEGVPNSRLDATGERSKVGPYKPKERSRN